MGLFTCITAASGLAGVRWNSRALLGMYSVLLVVMLLAQAVVAAALFTDKSWRRYLPPDETGEVKKVCAASCFTAKSNVLRRFGHISDHLQRKS